VTPAKTTVVQTLAGVETGGRWHGVTFELLGDAAALAQRLGGRVSAWCLTGPDGAGPDPAELGGYGCEHVCRLRHERLVGWSSEAVAAALERTLAPTCRAILLPGDARGEEVAALLAGRLGAAWVADALTLTVTTRGELDIAAAEPGGKLSRTARAPSARPVVVTIRPGVAEARRATPPRTVQVEDVAPDLSDVPPLTAVERHLPADPRTVDIREARRVVAGGRGTGGPEGMAAVAALAEVLHAAPAASRLAVDLGWAAKERQVGQTGKTVRPDLYVACGISGASHHLSGMRESRHIVAINPDRAAPIHEVAHLSLYGDLHRVIPAVLAALRRRSAPANGT
jgi:electron transfer flavoprotein alpha subunit